ncbi:hypothetical protein ACJX0J_032698, partial [Zea mays]
RLFFKKKMHIYRVGEDAGTAHFLPLLTKKGPSKRVEPEQRAICPFAEYLFPVFRPVEHELMQTIFFNTITKPKIAMCNCSQLSWNRLEVVTTFLAFFTDMKLATQYNPTLEILLEDWLGADNILWFYPFYFLFSSF